MAPTADEVTVQDGEARVEVFQSREHRDEVWRTRFMEGMSPKWEAEEVVASSDMDESSIAEEVAVSAKTAGVNTDESSSSEDASVLEDAVATAAAVAADESQSNKFVAAAVFVLTILYMLARGHAYSLSRAAISRASA